MGLPPPSATTNPIFFCRITSAQASTSTTSGFGETSPCFEDGESTSYGLFNTQERGTLFIGPQTPVYKGMICGQNARPDDLVVNVCKQKHVTNMRNASASEESLRLISVHPLTLEECLEFIDDDELLEITPKSLRMRKRELNHEQRARAAYRAKQ